MSSPSAAFATRPFLILDVEVGAPINIGPAGAANRRYVPITGGKVSGAIEGVILPGGDWQTVHDDGNLEIEAHYAFRAADGSVIEVISNGVRAGPAAVLQRLQAGAVVDAREYYFRTAIRFRTASPSWSHLNFRLAVSQGERRPDSVRLEVFEVL